jgi:hypothetical protein
VFRNLSIEADFLAPLQLHYPTIVDHQLDRPKADRAERLPKLSHEGRGERQIIVWPLWKAAGRLECEGIYAIYPIWLIG